VEILEGIRSIRMSANVNTYDPVHATGVGKAILAFLHPTEAEEILKKRPLTRLTPKTVTSISAHLKAFKRIREQGYVLDNEENELGARCVAAPIFDAQGRPIAAMSISGPVSHMMVSSIAPMAQKLMAATHKISSHLGYAANERKAVHERQDD
jgi:DNA-binding IclR family transcriptional regulator